MAGKSKTVAADGAVKEFKITLDEFLQRLSQSDRRVELIHGFHAHEKRARHLRDTESNFRKSLEDFANKPA